MTLAGTDEHLEGAAERSTLGRVRAAVVNSMRARFELQEVSLGSPREGEVRVRLIATGICHTDLNAAAGSMPFPLPGVLGHEGVGEVLEVGPGVQRLSKGDRVLLTYAACGTCHACRGGQPVYCVDHGPLNFAGQRTDGSTALSVDGKPIHSHFFGQSTFSEEAVVDESCAVKVPRGFTDDDLITLAPLGCGFQTGAGVVFNTLKPGLGFTLAIAGVGAVGFAALLAAKMTPTSRVIVADTVVSRLALAKELGATDIIDANNQDVTETLSELTAGRGVDAAIDTTGNVAVIESLNRALAIGGTLAIIGAPPAGATAGFDVNKLLPNRRIHGTTMGSSQPHQFLPLLMSAWRTGRLPIERLVRRYAFEDIQVAIADSKAGVSIKPVLVF